MTDSDSITEIDNKKSQITTYRLVLLIGMLLFFHCFVMQKTIDLTAAF